MLIDWFTTVAQVLNFLILVLLLRRFLYGPIVRAMDRREDKIRSRLEEADRRSQEAEDTRKEYEGKNREIDEKREGLLEQARREAEEERTRRMTEARQGVERLREGWLESLERDREAMLRDLRARAGIQLFAVARRALSDLAGADLEERMVEVFEGRVRDLDDDVLRALRQSAEDSGELVVESRFEVGASAKQAITRALHDHVTQETEVRYETSDDLVSGVRVRTGDSLVAWNLGKYLDDLEADVRQRLERRREAGTGEEEGPDAGEESESRGPKKAEQKDRDRGEDAP